MRLSEAGFERAGTGNDGRRARGLAAPRGTVGPYASSGGQTVGLALLPFVRQRRVSRGLVRLLIR